MRLRKQEKTRRVRCDMNLYFPAGIEALSLKKQKQSSYFFLLTTYASYLVQFSHSYFFKKIFNIAFDEFIVQVVFFFR